MDVKSGWLIRTRPLLRERRLLPLLLEEQPQEDLVQNSWTIRLSVPGGVSRGGQAVAAEAKAEGDALLLGRQGGDQHEFASNEECTQTCCCMACWNGATKYAAYMQIYRLY